MWLVTLLAQDAVVPGGDPGAGAAPRGCGLGPAELAIFAIIYLIFWLLIFRPQQKERKAKAAKLAALKKGDKVVTRGGIVGVVKQVTDTELVLQVGSDSKLQVRFVKDAVDDVVTGESAEKK